MTYSGLFIRHYLDQTPGSSGSAWSESPDIIPYGTNIEPDLSKFTSEEGYKKDWAKNVMLTQPNQVYIRGLNTANGAQASRAYFYYTESDLMLWPANWRSDNVEVNRQPQYWLDISATSANERTVGQLPLVWTAPELHGSQWDHYCLVCWVDNSSTPQPPDLNALGKMNSTDELAQFIIAHPNMGWRNTVDVLSPAPEGRYGTNVTIPADGAVVNLSVQFPNIPPDGTFDVNLQGTGPENSIALPRSSLTDYQGGYAPRSPLIFRSKFKTSITVGYWQGATPPPDNAKVVIKLMVEVSPMLRSLADIVHASNRAAIPIETVTMFDDYGVASQVDVITLGQQAFDMKFGEQG